MNDKIYNELKSTDISFSDKPWYDCRIFFKYIDFRRNIYSIYISILSNIVTSFCEKLKK